MEPERRVNTLMAVVTNFVLVVVRIVMVAVVRLGTGSTELRHLGDELVIGNKTVLDVT